MNQIHWRANNHFIYLENRCKYLRVRGKSIFLGLEPSTMIQTSRNFSPLLTFESIRRCLDKSIGEFSMVHIKKMSALIWLRVYNHDFGSYLVQLYQGLLRVFRIGFSLLFHARLLTCKSARKWHLMRICIS